MSAVSESIAQRMTLGMLAERYGFDIDPEFASNVTITSLSNAVDTILPICPVPSNPVPMRLCCPERAVAGISSLASRWCSAIAATICSVIWPVLWQEPHPMLWRYLPWPAMMMTSSMPV